MRKKTLTSVVAALSLGSLALVGCKSADKPAEGEGDAASQPAEGEAGGGEEGSCGGEEGSCGGEGGCGGN